MYLNNNLITCNKICATVIFAFSMPFLHPLKHSHQDCPFSFEHDLFKLDRLLTITGSYQIPRWKGICFNKTFDRDYCNYYHFLTCCISNKYYYKIRHIKSRDSKWTREVNRLLLDIIVLKWLCDGSSKYFLKQCLYF